MVLCQPPSIVLYVQYIYVQYIHTCNARPLQAQPQLSAMVIFVVPADRSHQCDIPYYTFYKSGAKKIDNFEV